MAGLDVVFVTCKAGSLTMNKTAKKVQEYAEIFVKILDTDYLRLNIDLVLNNVDPRFHFLEYGRHEHRQYSYIIDESYIRQLAEYKKCGEGKTGIEFFFSAGGVPPNSWLDLEYINKNNSGKYGNWIEVVRDIYDNKIARICPYFDDAYYLENAAQRGIEVKGNALLHYLSEGWRHGIDFHPYFDTWYFVEKNNLREINKPYLLYLFDNRLYEISPFFNIAYFNHVSKADIKGNYHKLYKYLFANRVAIDRLHPDLKESITQYIVNGESIFESGSLSLPQPQADILPEFIKHARTLATSRAADPTLSIIIVNYRRPLLTILSACSAIIASKDINTEIIIVENQSDRFETEILYRHFANCANVKIIALKDNVYFGEANNIGIENSHGKLVLFLNNDAFITASALKDMVTSIHDNVVAVSAVAINNSRQVVEAGGTITGWNDVIQNLKGRKYDIHLKTMLAQEKCKYVDYSSAACLLLDREFLNKFGSFDPRFEPFYYEDTDLCKRIISTGHKILLLTQHTYLHLENTSTRQLLKDNFNNVVARSRDRFLEKWGGGEPGPTEIAVSKPVRHKYRAGIYTPFRLAPGGGENYILSILAVVGSKCNAFLITPAPVSRYRVLMVAEQLGIKLPPFEILTEEEALALSFDIVITMGNSIVPEKKFQASVFYYHCQFPFPLYYDAYHHNKSDHGIAKYICNSHYTRREIEREISKYKLDQTRIEVIYPPVRIADQPAEELLAAKNETVTFVTVGRFFVYGHRKNQDKILKALLHASQRHKLRAYIYGSLGPREEDRQFYQGLLQGNANPDIVIDANVSHQAICDAYKRSHFYIHAAGLDTPREIKNSESEHFGISLVEAMSYGCVPIIFGHGGPKEILAESGVGFQYQSMSELCSILSHVVKMPNFKDYFVKNALDSINVAKRFELSKFNAKIANLMLEAFSKLEKIHSLAPEQQCGS